MDYLYAPWRSDYTESTERSKRDDTNEQSCIFCLYVKSDTQQDTQHFIVKRFSRTFIMFNRYPYNPGHLLVVPTEHIGTLEGLPQETRSQLMEVSTLATTILREHARAQGFNIGVNMGAIAGASIPDHLHMHILPRWRGDTNFLPTLSNTKTISTDLDELYQKLKPHFDAISL